MTDVWNLPVAFYFEVNFGNDILACKEVSGLTVEMDLETIREGGVNDYEHQVPRQMKHGSLVLKGALHDKESALVVWIRKILEGDFSESIQTRNILIHLMSSEGKPYYTWACNGAYPIKWEIDALDASKNQVLIESLEFAYTTLKRT